MRRYESYKDSGVEWLGEIPSHWECLPIRSIFKFRNEKNDPIKTDNILSLSIANGVTEYSDENRGGNKRKDDLSSYKLAYPNDIVLNSMNVIVGAVGVSKYFGAISPVYYALSLYNQRANLSYYENIFKNENFQRGLLRFGKGILIKFGENGKMNTIRMKISQDDLKKLYFPIPPLDEQQKIAQFLDDKTAKIGQAVDLAEKQITLLKEHKQILIQNAVTRGLNPDVPLKDSGVEWIGQVPEHWEVKKIKHVTSKIGSGITPLGGGSNYIDGGIPLLRSQNIHFDRIDLNDVARISEFTHNSMKNSKVRKGDVLLNITGGSLGRCFYVDSNEEMNVNQHVCIIRPNKKINTIFLNMLLASEIGQKQIWFFQQGGGREGLNFQAIKNFYLPLPDLEEQQKIAIYLNKQATKIDQAIALKTAHIEKLKEYKSVLINDVVTGKVRVSV